MKTVFFTLLVALLMPSLATSQDCIDYGGDYLHRVGGVDTPKSAQGVTVVGNYAYVTNGRTIGDSSLLVIDISEPESPVIVGEVYTPGYASDVAVSGDFAYVAAGPDGLLVVIVMFPESPVIIGSVDTPGYASEVAIVGSYAYLADGTDGGFQVIDISEPTSPTIVGETNTPGTARGVAVAGSFAYVACMGEIGLQVIDISLPESPEAVGSVNTPRSGLSVTVSGSYAYMATDGAGLQVIEISDPESPKIVGAADSPGSAHCIAVAGNYAYLTWWRGGLQVIDISDPETPEILGTLHTTGDANGVTVAGHYAYLADGGSGLQVIDITYPESPPVAGGVDTPANVENIAISNNLVGAACPDEFFVIDVSDGMAPVVQGTLGPPSYGEYREVTVSGDIAYLITGWPSQLLAVSLSVPDAPQVVGTLETGGEAHGVANEDHFVYIANGLSGLQVVNVSDPGSPSISSNFMTVAAARLVAVAGGMAYVALGDWYGFNGLEVIDVSDPTWPIHRGVVETPSVASDIVVVDDHVYVGYGEPGLRIVDVSEPTTPVIVGSWENGAEVTGVSVFGGYAYVSLFSGTLYVLDVSLPSSPSLVGSLWQYGYSQDVVFNGEWVIVARGMDGLQTCWPQCGDLAAIGDNLENEIPGYDVGLRVYPNPFNPQTTISFDLDRSEWVETAIFDLTGHRVDVLTNRQFTAGTHSVTWNGHDSRGRAMPSGAYIVRVATGSQMKSRKVILIR